MVIISGIVCIATKLLLHVILSWSSLAVTTYYHYTVIIMQHGCCLDTHKYFQWYNYWVSAHSY